MNIVVTKNIIYNRFKSIVIILFVFALPFDYYDFFGGTSFLSISKSLGFLYLLISLFDIKKSFSLIKIKKILIPLFILWFWISIQSLMNYSAKTSFEVFDTTFLMGIFLFWITFNDIANRVIRFNSIILSIVFSMLLVSVLIQLGIGIEINLEEIGSTRVRFFGMNPNSLGIFANLGLAIVIAMVVNPSNYFKKKTYLLILVIPNLLFLIGLSGSRSAIYIAVFSIMISVFFIKTKFLYKTIFVLFSVIIAFFSFSEIMKIEVMEKRINKTIDSGEIGERERVWNTALEIAELNRFFGWGKIGYEEQMIKRYGYFMDTHNLFLYFFTSGFSLFFLI